MALLPRYLVTPHAAVDEHDARCRGIAIKDFLWNN